MTFETSWNKFKIGLGFDIENGLAQDASVDTGDLKNGIASEVVGDTIVITMPIQGMYQEFGTPPHIIRPVTAKALHWKNPAGEDVFAKVVHHPGTRPNPFIRTFFAYKIADLVQKNLDRSFT